jgi:hypothetical protein
MLELLLKKETIEKNQHLLLVLGFFAVTVSMAMAFVIFKELSSFAVVFLASMAVVPTVLLLTRNEPLQQRGFIRHQKLIRIYAMIFFSMALAWAIWFAVLPADIIKTVFSTQLSKVPVTGLFTGIEIFSSTGLFSGLDPLFMKIFLNNIGLVMSFFMLSFFYGYGSMLLIGWNASILGLIWGNAFRAFVDAGATTLLIRNGLIIMPYLLPEVLAYFLAAVAGGIIYLNISQHKNEDITVDSLKLLWFAVVLILVGAIVETIILRSLL